jgi:hypothetical protein
MQYTNTTTRLKGTLDYSILFDVKAVREGFSPGNYTDPVVKTKKCVTDSSNVKFVYVMENAVCVDSND